MLSFNLKNTIWVCSPITSFFIHYPYDRKESTSSGPTKFEVLIVAQFDNHNSQVWRVSWNITSTLLASSGDDGCVRLWKGGWKQIMWLKPF